ncbi:hypothetical protein EV363DRAFT_1402521 [Boletus edulis]|nr:hypothetical protein EV363DRAFT_1402521 [Boletus edulis]
MPKGFIRHEGRGGAPSLCSHCQRQDGVYRCEDCFSIELHCLECIVKLHISLPFHRIKQWNGSFFMRIPLKSLGLRIQLGHPASQSCIRPVPASTSDDFVVVNINGVHEVSLDFCGCETAQSRMKQLLRARLYPATVRDPRTAATFQVLQQFHILSFESKTSAYEFYSALARLSDNTGTQKPRDRYDEFVRMIREWRNLKLLKRSGRAHDPAGLDETKAGQCAVLCPACPQPGKNLHVDFLKAPPTQSWIYTLFVGIGANFRLKRRNVSADSVDPSLNGGSAYFVEENAFKSYLLLRMGDTQEKSTCSGHTAVNLVNSKKSHGLAATGVGTVDCARHNTKLPTAVGDLQKGEKYTNMDYLFFSAVQHFPSLTRVFASYDIACQWSKHLWERMETLPPSLRFEHGNDRVDFAVPKFHLPAHKETCQLNYSFNFIPWVGRTDGEAPERGWANINPVASSTKEMGSGSRRDTLDDFFGDWNWKKTTGLHDALLTKLKEAVMQRHHQCIALQELEAALPLGRVSQWTAEVEAWEADRERANPFQRKREVVTQAKIRLELAKEEAKLLQEGDDISLDSEVSPSVLISTGLDLEDQQRRLSAEISSLPSDATDEQRLKVQTRINVLQRKIESWTSYQMLYMPLLARQRASELSKLDPLQEARPHLFNLLLPSQCPPSFSARRLKEYEWKLRFAQTMDALEDIRQNLRLRSYLLKFKKTNIRGQVANTRVQNTLNTVKDRLDANVRKYRTARAALMSLSPALEKTGWDSIIRELLDDDIRSLTVGLDGQTEGRRTLSWIWQTLGVTKDQDEDLQDALRVEWCKVRARSHRWTEEVILLLEEMRRVKQFFDWKVQWWREQSAYGSRQATLFAELKASCEKKWNNVPGLVRMKGQEAVITPPVCI